MRKKGFTLVELLVVVAIIALLISMLLPSLNEARDTARMVACMSNFRQLGVANQMYADANQDLFVPVKTAHGTNGSGYYAWVHNITYRQMLGTGPKVDPRLPMRCPVIKDVTETARNSNNSFGWNWAKVVKPDGNFDLHVGVVRSKVTRPAETIWLIDGTDWHILKHFANYVVKWDVYGDTELWSVGYRHSDGANALYFDGHAESHSKYHFWPESTSARDAMWDVYK